VEERRERRVRHGGAFVRNFSIEPVSKSNVFHRTFYGYIALIMCKLKIHLRY